jgi:leucyl/phenylalanyl-tRNA--protein transferase
MPICPLGKVFIFPPVSLAMEDGLLAVAATCRPTALLEAYRQGILSLVFPWGTHPLVGSQPRFVLFPDEISSPAA